jgi:Zn2+/Cd2+-exporting ATPase
VGPTQCFVDKFTAIYSPAVFVVAHLVALLPLLLMGSVWSEWTCRALVWLVISTSVSIVSVCTALAGRGLFINGGA